jgi:hypothetical protein
MKNIDKKSLLEEKIQPYLKTIESLTDDDIEILKSMLEKEEQKKLDDYIAVNTDNITHKRIFLYICNILDFQEIVK